MINVRLSRLIYGLGTFMPGVYNRFSMPKLTVEEMAIDGYSKWLHHMAIVVENGFGNCPKVVAEVGPGPACAAGIAALVAGCRQYYALDVINHADHAVMAPVFDEIVRLYKRKADLREWRSILARRPFPSSILPDDHLIELLSPSRLARLRCELEAPHARNGAMRVFVPWDNPSVIEEGTVDLVFSTAALEHVDDLPVAYAAMQLWVRLDGLVSHVIDYGCHGSCNEWNGHWACPNALWRMMRGNRPYYINRLPHSVHIRLLLEHGFEILSDKRLHQASRLRVKNLTPDFARLLNPEDLGTVFSFLQARRVQRPTSRVETTL